MPIQTVLAHWFGSFILLALLVAGQSTISLGSGSIHYLIQYECNCDLLEVGFHLVKDSLVVKYPILCLRRPVLAPLPLTHECRKNGLTALWD